MCISVFQACYRYHKYLTDSFNQVKLSTEGKKKKQTTFFPPVFCLNLLPNCLLVSDIRLT